MKIYKNKKNILLAIVVLIVAAITVYGIFSYVTGSWPFQSTKNLDPLYTPATQGQIQAGEETTEQTNSDNPTTLPETDRSSSVEMEITSINQTSSELIVRTLIQSISSSGTCTLSLSKDNTTAAELASGVQPVSSYSTCQGFNVPLRDVAPGEYTLSITYSNSNREVSQINQVVRINE